MREVIICALPEFKTRPTNEKIKSEKKVDILMTPNSRDRFFPLNAISNCTVTVKNINIPVFRVIS